MKYYFWTAFLCNTMNLDAYLFQLTHNNYNDNTNENELDLVALQRMSQIL